MNLGELFDLSHDALRSAAAGMAGGPGPSGTLDLLTALTARSAVYDGLARCVVPLAGGALTIEQRTLEHSLARRLAAGMPRSPRRHADTLYAYLRAAAGTGIYPPAAVASSAASGGLLRAADLIGAAGDLLAGHVPAGQPPRTPQGAAIRLGGATREGLAAIARVTHQAVQVDRQLGGWISRTPSPGGGVDQYDAALSPTRWTLSSGLDDLARELMRTATGKPDLHLLRPAQPAAFDAPPMSRDPVARFLGARDWLWRNRSDIDARHLRAATQLGLGIIVLTGGQRREAWRGAAASAVHLSSVPTSGPAALVATTLADLATDVRDLLHAGSAAPARAAAMADLLPALPELAHTLRNGLAAAVARRGIFIAEAGLSAQPVKLVYRYRTSARPATSHDHVVVELDRRLSICTGRTDRPPATQMPSAAQAFPAPPRPSAQAPDTVRHTPDQQAASRRRHR